MRSGKGEGAAVTVTEAYQILELSPGAEMGEIKKKYRHLMHRMHPDVYFSSGEQPSHPAQELNLAYAVLKKELAGKTHFAACPERNISFPFILSFFAIVFFKLSSSIFTFTCRTLIIYTSPN